MGPRSWARFLEATAERYWQASGQSVRCALPASRSLSLPALGTLTNRSPEELHARPQARMTAAEHHRVHRPVDLLGLPLALGAPGHADGDVTGERLVVVDLGSLDHEDLAVHMLGEV